ncbi:outer membrane pore protein [Shigella sonnei]|nr:outer membrane pore protein [Shigella sonnei]
MENWVIQELKSLDIGDSRLDKRVKHILNSWICPYISRHLLSLNPLQARCRRYSRGER